MKAIISSTYDDKYIYFLPIVTYCWNKLGVDVICFMPQPKSDEENIKLNLCLESIGWANSKNEIEFFTAPEHKEATYAQCARLYGACLDLPEDEVLITGDVDMLMFRLPEMREGGFSIFGSDLVPENQYPMCYISAKVKDWRNAFELNDKSYQQCLDELMKDRDSISMRSDFWALDQEIAFNKINLTQGIHYIPRTNGQNQFATHRIDRDDSFYKDRLDSSVYDVHLWRPGYDADNANKILELMQYFYPEDNFDWIKKYTEEYLKLLK